MTVKEVLPAPRDWVVFHYHTASDGKVTDWFWQPLSYVAHCLDADGQSAILPCLGKSTYARAGIITNFTPFEPSWEGFVTIEISNTTPLPAKIYANEGIAQVLISENEQPEVSYADRKGKYQGQTGITVSKVLP